MSTLTEVLFTPFVANWRWFICGWNRFAQSRILQRVSTKWSCPFHRYGLRQNGSIKALVFSHGMLVSERITCPTPFLSSRREVVKEQTESSQRRDNRFFFYCPSKKNTFCRGSRTMTNLWFQGETMSVYGQWFSPTETSCQRSECKCHNASSYFTRLYWESIHSSAQGQEVNRLHVSVVYRGISRTRLLHPDMILFDVQSMKLDDISADQGSHLNHCICPKWWLEEIYAPSQGWSIRTWREKRWVKVCFNFTWYKIKDPSGKR